MDGLTLATLLGLIDRIVQLLTRDEQQRANFFNNFVEPARREFEVVHRDYVDSFSRCIELLQKSEYPMDHHHPVFQAIERDSLSSDHLRTTLSSAYASIKHPWAGELVVALTGYLQVVPGLFRLGIVDEIGFDMHGHELETPIVDHANIVRTKLKDHLRDTVNSERLDAEMRSVALLHLRSALARLQESHGFVTSAFASLKTRLLNAI